jgi:ParB/RepB/Spo0J family partition protein
MDLELHQLELPYAALRIRTPGASAHLLAALMEQGQRSPVFVVAKGEARYVLIDGYRRVEALQRLGRDTVEAAILPLAECEALISGYLQERRRRSPLEEGWLLKELKERHGMSSLAMAEALQRSASWVSRRLALVLALPETIQEMVRRGAIGAHAAMRSLVPLARGNCTEAGKLAAAIAGKKLSTREVEDLAAAFCAGTRSTRHRLLDDPLLFLKAHKEARQAPPLHPVEQLRNDLEALAAIARRAHRRSSETFDSLQGAERQEILRCFDQARADFLRLSCRMRKEKRDAGSGKARRDPQPS